MLNTMRDKIIAAINARLRTINSGATVVGKVVEAGTLGPSEIAAELAVGKYVLETIGTDDERTDETYGFETYRFAMAVIAYCPALSARTPSSLAADIHGEVYLKLCAVSAYAPAGFPANTIDNLALDCQMQGGGAAGIDPDTGGHQGFSVVEVKYRHLVGDPTQ